MYTNTTPYHYIGSYTDEDPEEVWEDITVYPQPIATATR